MRTSTVATIMFFLAALLGALGQFLYKSGAERAGASALTYLLNVRLLWAALIAWCHAHPSD